MTKPIFYLAGCHSMPVGPYGVWLGTPLNTFNQFLGALRLPQLES
jgi:hypothetical protein